MSLRERFLLERLRDHDEAAFSEIVREYQDRVFSLVSRMIGDRGEAEDLAQEVFVTVFKQIGRFRGDSKLSTWIYRIAVNHCKNRIKYLAVRQGGADGTAADADAVTEALDHGAHARAQAAGVPVPSREPGPLETLEGRELARLIESALATLEEESRLVVVLRDVDELSYQEIGEVTGLPEGTVKSRLHRARMQIKEFIERRTKG